MILCLKPAPKPSSIIIFNVSRDNIIIESAVCFLKSGGHTVQKLASIFLHLPWLCLLIIIIFVLHCPSSNPLFCGRNKRVAVQGTTARGSLFAEPDSLLRCARYRN